MSGVHGTYLSLLIAIQENPFATIAELGDRVGISKPTVIRKMNELEEERYFGVRPLLNYDNLRLDSVDVLLDTDSMDDVVRLEEIATNHPYTAYRSRCYGSFNGLFLQFRPPNNTSQLVEELVKILHDEGTVTNYQFLMEKYRPTIRTSMRLEGWDDSTQNWDFDWDNWFTKDFGTTIEKAPDDSLNSVFEWLTKKDLYILQQLMLGPRRTNKEMIEIIESKGVQMSPQTFGRRRKRIEKECIARYRVSFRPEVFDTITNVLITGKSKKSFLQSLYSRMVKEPVPFESSLRVSESNLYWYIRIPPSHLSFLLGNLHPELTGIKVTFMDYRNSFVYSIWPETYDEDNNDWKRERSFLIDQALQ